MENIDLSTQSPTDNALPDCESGIVNDAKITTGDEQPNQPNQPNLICAGNTESISYVMVFHKRYTEQFFSIAKKDIPDAKKKMVVDGASHLRRTLPQLSAIIDKCKPNKDKEYVTFRTRTELEAQMFFSFASSTVGENFIDAFRVMPNDVEDLNRLYLYFRRIREVERLFEDTYEYSKFIMSELNNIFPVGSYVSNIDEITNLEKELHVYKAFCENQLALLFQRIRFNKTSIA